MAQGGASLASIFTDSQTDSQTDSGRRASPARSPRRLRGVAASSDTRLRSQVTSPRLVYDYDYDSTVQSYRLTVYVTTSAKWGHVTRVVKTRDVNR